MNLSRPFSTIIASLLFCGQVLAQETPDEDEAFLSGTEKETTQDAKKTLSPPPPAERLEPQEIDEDAAYLAGEEIVEIEAPVVDTDALREEQKDKWYFTLGARLRWLMIPEWMLKGGVDIRVGTQPEANDSRGPLISHLGVGPEFIARRNGFDLTASVWWVSLGWDGQVSFKSKNDDGNSWEVIENDMSALFISMDFIWSHPFTDWFALTYGVGAGLGVVIGDLIRTEARQTDPTSEVEGTVPCTGVQDDDPWCAPGEEYGETRHIPVVPWFNLLGGVRFKPHRNIAIYVDGGVGTGFFAGARGGYVF